MIPVLFVDANMLIEALLSLRSASYIVAEMVARGAFDLATCQLCVDDAEDAIMAKMRNKPEELEKTLANWEKFKSDTRLIVLEDPDAAQVQATRDKYLGVMRHLADIPVLAAALAMNPHPHMIISGNRNHFNDAVADRAGIQICSCDEFIDLLSEES